MESMVRAETLGQGHDAAVPMAVGLDAPVSPSYHPLPNLLQLSAEEILAVYRDSQRADFTKAFASLYASRGNLVSVIDLLGRYLAAYPNESLTRRLDVRKLETLFNDVHEHVMAHPVWVHPLFTRIARGDLTMKQLVLFAQHYFTQVKNTRQCVALSLGRFHTLLDRSDGEINNAISELTQVVLAGLLADEYGVHAHSHDPSAMADGSGDADEAIDLRALFAPTTHATLYRDFLDELGLGTKDYDPPALHGVADNVLVQRIVAGDPGYDHVESLASVGLGMEWGVPAFFSMIIAGILKLGRGLEREFDPDGLKIWSAHVVQDVEHAVAVMIVTSFYARKAEDMRRIKGATNALMAFRYEMLSDLYLEIFGTACPRVDEIRLDPRYLLDDRRIERLLPLARKSVRPSSVRDYESYVTPRPSPRIFLS